MFSLLPISFEAESFPAYGETLSAEVAPFNIRVSVVVPGIFDTGLSMPMVGTPIADYDRAREELSPLGRLYDAEKQYIDAVLESEERHKECANDLDFALVRRKLGLPADTLGVVPDGEEDSRDPVSDDEE